VTAEAAPAVALPAEPAAGALLFVTFVVKTAVVVMSHPKHVELPPL
jgi:hypothetical protein